MALSSMSNPSDGFFLAQYSVAKFGGKISGNLEYTGAIMTLRITGAKNEHLGNRITFQHDRVVQG